MSVFTLVASVTTAVCVYANRKAVGVAPLCSDDYSSCCVDYRRARGGDAGRSGNL